MGILDPNFELLDSPLACDAEYCPCDEGSVMPQDDRKGITVKTIEDKLTKSGSSAEPSALCFNKGISLPGIFTISVISDVRIAGFIPDGWKLLKGIPTFLRKNGWCIGKGFTIGMEVSGLRLREGSLFFILIL